MNFIRKLKSGLYRDYQFMSEQKYGWKTPADPYSIPKYLLKPWLPPNPVIIDCGSNDGSDSIELARIFPKGQIHSFEPVSKVFAALQENTRKYKNIHCYELALSADTGNAKMYVSSGVSDAASSLLPPKSVLEDHKALVFENTIEVQCKTLDDWAEQYNIPKVDFLWLDMQGGEYEMLKASKKILDSVKVILTEVSLKETYENVPLYAEFSQWLGEKGFEVKNEAIPAGTDMGNALFVRR
jgi:2-O-methyltransferase